MHSTTGKKAKRQKGGEGTGNGKEDWDMEKKKLLCALFHVVEPYRTSVTTKLDWPYPHGGGTWHGSIDLTFIYIFFSLPVTQLACSAVRRSLVWLWWHTNCCSAFLTSTLVESKSLWCQSYLLIVISSLFIYYLVHFLVAQRDRSTEQHLLLPQYRRSAIPITSAATNWLAQSWPEWNRSSVFYSQSSLLLSPRHNLL